MATRNEYLLRRDARDEETKLGKLALEADEFMASERFWSTAGGTAASVGMGKAITAGLLTPMLGTIGLPLGALLVGGAYMLGAKGGEEFAEGMAKGGIQWGEDKYTKGSKPKWGEDDSFQKELKKGKFFKGTREDTLADLRDYGADKWKGDLMGAASAATYHTIQSPQAQEYLGEKFKPFLDKVKGIKDDKPNTGLPKFMQKTKRKKKFDDLPKEPFVASSGGLPSLASESGEAVAQKSMLEGFDEPLAQTPGYGDIPEEKGFSLLSSLTKDTTKNLGLKPSKEEFAKWEAEKLASYNPDAEWVNKYEAFKPGKSKYGNRGWWAGDRSLKDRIEEFHLTNEQFASQTGPFTPVEKTPRDYTSWWGEKMSHIRPMSEAETMTGKRDFNQGLPKFMADTPRKKKPQPSMFAGAVDVPPKVNIPETPILDPTTSIGGASVTPLDPKDTEALSIFEKYKDAGSAYNTTNKDIYSKSSFASKDFLKKSEGSQQTEFFNWFLRRGN